jgi:hypothetical protein
MNMLIWHKELWLIDHGAALYFHHSSQNWEEQSRRPFLPIKDHVLLPFATDLRAIDAEFRPILTPERIESIVSLIPDDWLTNEPLAESADEQRRVYVQFLVARLATSETFVNAAIDAQQALV